MEIIEEVNNNNRIKIIAISRITTVINSRDLTNSRAGKFKCIILKLIGMRIQMWGQTQLRRLSSHNSLFQKRKIISLRLKIHKIIITFLRIITISNSATGLILLITKLYPNNSNKDLCPNKIGNNLSNKITTKDLLLRMNSNRINFNNNQIISIIILTMSLTNRLLSLVHRS